MRTIIHHIWSVSVIAFAATRPCLAQCTEWDTQLSLQGVNGTVNAMVEFDDGTGPALYAGGSFLTAGGVSARRIAKWDGAGWSALGSGIGSSNSDSVLALAVFDDGSGSALYAAGQFSVAGGTNTNLIAKWNGTSWSPVGSGLGASGRVWALTVHDDGAGPALYAGGAELQLVGFVAKWDGVSWTELNGSPDDEVDALLSFDDGSGPALFVGGSFYTVGGGVIARGIAKWNGTAWSKVGSGFPGPFGQVFALTVFDDDGTGPKLYAGGPMSLQGSSALQAVLRLDGASWSAPGDGMQFSGSSGSWANAFAVFDDGSGSALYAGGDFHAAGGSAHNIAKWNGSSWSALGSGANGVVWALRAADIDSFSALYVGGEFTSAGGAVAQHIARWTDCIPGSTFCFGDGVDSLVSTPCPCGNFGDRGHGCANSNATLGGAHLIATGRKNPNSVLLTCAGVPNGNLCTFLRSTGNNPSGAVFGDGVSCISGPIVRFGQQFAGQDWNEPYTVQAEPVAVAPGNTRYYAVQYRNPAPAFCPGGAFNVSNGYVIHW